jgi:hypothetical protein
VPGEHLADGAETKRAAEATPSENESASENAAVVSDSGAPDRPSAPHIVVHETVAGRETLAAIAEELRPQGLMPRAPLSTLGYGDRISNAPGNPNPAVARYLDGPPEVSVRESIAGRDTLAAIDRELALPREATLPANLELLEMMTFIVRGAGVEGLVSETMRSRLVRERLLHRLPVKSMSDIERIDASPWGRGALLIRVWCRLPQ